MTNTVQTITDFTLSEQHFGILPMFMEADIIVKSVIIILLVFSIVCWAIIVDKWLLFRGLKFKTAKFEKMFSSKQSLQQIYTRLKKRADNPLSTLFILAMRQMQEGDLKEVKSPNQALKESVKHKIASSLYSTKNRALSRLEQGLILLASIGASAPFIGLFGTVWGIMHSFQSIAATKNTTLAVVAPGIAEALFATAIGLFAAIPAVVAYNLFVNQVRNYSIKADDFITELNTLISHEIDLDRHGADGE